MLSQSNPNLLLPDWFLAKYNCDNFVTIDDRLKKSNELLYPNPTYLGHNELLEYYNKPEYKAKGWNLTWRKIKKYTKNGWIRTEPVTILAKAKVPYNPNNPDHQGKELAETFKYAVQDFEPFLDKDRAIEDEKLKMKKGVYNKKGLWRDFNHDKPELSDIEGMKDSIGTFYSYLAISELVEKTDESKLTPEAKNELREFLLNAIPKTTLKEDS